MRSIAPRATSRWLEPALLAGVAAGAAVSFGCGTSGPGSAALDSTSGRAADSDAAAAAVSYVGSDECAGCHTRQAELWTGSHHDRSMQFADAETVLGDFDDATVTHADGGVTSFHRRDGGYWMRMTDARGESRDVRVEYTFGVEPLQQYLVRLDRGRYQAPPVAWDSRTEDDGGQRWFDLAPAISAKPGDPLHWTGRDRTWNTMCAECHSTNVRKGYDPQRDAYATAYSAIDVACEACHGPGGDHVQWAAAHERDGAEPAPDDRLGLVVRLRDPVEARWNIDPTTGTASRTPARGSGAEIVACSRCHSRRTPLAEGYRPGDPLGDTHRLVLLEEGLYWPDGQILDEVYVYGSFVQSRMYAAGVTCSDCHEPHSTKVYSTGNALCGRCHEPARFDTPEHTRHPLSSPGGRCVECHMPAQTYMGNDPRRDHGIRVPRPDLSAELGTPNACTACHTERGDEWAAARIVEWFGEQRRDDPHFGEALAAGRAGSPAAHDGLVALAGEWEEPPIARATALAALRAVPSPDALAVIERALGNADPLIRRGALEGLETSSVADRARLGAPLLRDPVRDVRIEAVRILTTIPEGALDVGARRALGRRLPEYEESLRLSGDRPEAQLALGTLYASTGRPEEAEQAYRRALAMAPEHTATHVNLADLLRSLDRDAEAERLLRRAVEIAPDDAAVRHALGLALVRGGRYGEAVPELGRAAQLRPDRSRYALAHALALDRVGRTVAARSALEQALRGHPDDRDLRLALDDLLRRADGEPEQHDDARYQGISAALPTGSAAVSADGLVAAWDMESVTEDGRLRDSSGHGHHGRFVAASTASATFGRARVFRTVEDRVLLDSSPDFDLDGPLTVAARLRVDELGLHQHVVACDDKWALWVTPEDRFRLGDTRGGGWSTAPGSVARGDWVSVVAVLRGTRGDPLTADTVALWIDGQRADAEMHLRSDEARAAAAWNPGDLYPTDACSIGFESHQGNEAHQQLPFVGAIDELLIFARALEETEVRAFASR